MNALISVAILLSLFDDARFGELKLNNALPPLPNAVKPHQHLQAKQPLQGNVVWLDRARQTLWINLGQANGLKTGEKLSVMEPADDEAVKGQVEVVRLLGPHLSEARIVKEQANRPIGKGDPISP